MFPPRPRRFCRSQSGIAGCSSRAQLRTLSLDAPTRSDTPCADPSPTPATPTPTTHATRRHPADAAAPGRVSQFPRPRPSRQRRSAPCPVSQPSPRSLRHGHYCFFFDRTALQASRPSGDDTATTTSSSIALPCRLPGPAVTTRPLLLPCAQRGPPPCFLHVFFWVLDMSSQFAGLGLWPLGAPSVTDSASAAALAPVAAALPAASAPKFPICQSSAAPAAPGFQSSFQFFSIFVFPVQWSWRPHSRRRRLQSRGRISRIRVVLCYV